MLDQGQTITINAVPQAYNLTQFDGYKTERTGTLANGKSTKVRLDHTESGNSVRHLHQYQEAIVDSETSESGTITCNVTLSAPAWADKTRLADIHDGFTAWISTILDRTLNMES